MRGRRCSLRERTASAGMAPAFLLWLAGGREIGSHDVLLAAAGRDGAALPFRDDLDEHPRVQRARTWRNEVRVLGDERGVVTLGEGVGGLLSMGVEVADGSGARGHGRQLIVAALASVPAGQTVLAEVAPGNARSLRAFLAAGFRPLGAIVHIRRQTGGGTPGRTRSR